MATGLQFVVLLCVLWVGAQAGTRSSDACCKSCPSGWTTYRQNCYRFYYKPRTWAHAESLCTYIGGNLASLQSRREYLFLRRMIYRVTGSYKSTWLGGYDNPKYRIWLWSDGSRFKFRRWGRREPNNKKDGNNCMEMNYKGRSYVNDSQCLNKKAYMCKRSM